MLIIFYRGNLEDWLNFKIDSIKTNNYLLNPRVDDYDISKIRIKFEGSFLN